MAKETANELRMRDNLSTSNSSVIASLNQGNVVEILSHTEIEETIGDNTSYRYKIKWWMVLQVGYSEHFIVIFTGLSADKKVNGNNKIPVKHKYLFMTSPPKGPLSIPLRH